MSGGVDSSVVACLLKEQEHDVIGVRFQLWQDPLAPAITKVLPTKCCDAQTLARVRSVCRQLTIPLHTLNLEEEFKCAVVDPFLAACRSGTTPNPCVLCNRSFKFRQLLRLAQRLKCDRVATGHYARIVRKQGGYALLEAKDRTKDQSYFLARLSQAELSRTILPLGTKTKRETFALAKKYQIPLDPVSYKESQDLCFIPEKSPALFLRRYVRDAVPGPIKSPDGKVIGTHEGLAFYTVGQRRGLKIGGQKVPMHVLNIDQKSNTIFVAPSRALYSNYVYVNSITFTRKPLQQNTGIHLMARIRARTKKGSGTLTFRLKKGLFSFSKPVFAPTAGQAIVLYRGREIVGSGIITHPAIRKTIPSARKSATIARRSL